LLDDLPPHGANSVVLEARNHGRKAVRMPEKFVGFGEDHNIVVVEQFPLFGFDTFRIPSEVVVCGMINWLDLEVVHLGCMLDAVVAGQVVEHD